MKKNIKKELKDLSSKEIKHIFYQETKIKMKKDLDDKTFNNAYNKVKLESKRLYQGEINKNSLDCLKAYLMDLKEADISHFYLECESGDKNFTLNNDFRRNKQ